MNIDEYKAQFTEAHKFDPSCTTKEADTRAGRALTHALDIRKFEIELYWKRGTYFWTFIAAAFAGYALTQKTAYDPELSLIFSSLGLVFSFAWYLVNRGSKFWQSNWERHVDLLEDMTLGPLYKIVIVTEDNNGSNFLTSPAQFSVSKLNQILSLFVVFIWLILFGKSLLPISYDLPVNTYKLIYLLLVAVFLLLLYVFGKSSQQFTPGLHKRSLNTYT